MRRRFAVVVGALTGLAGLALVLTGGVGRSLEWLFVLGVAGVAGGQALRMVWARRSAQATELDTPDPERRYESPVPGDDTDDLLSVAWSRGRQRSREQLRGRVREVAVSAITNAEGCSRADALDRIRRGDWTDDAMAAWFLAEAVELDRIIRLRLRIGERRSRFAVGFDRAVRAIEALGGGNG